MKMLRAFLDEMSAPEIEFGDASPIVPGSIMDSEYRVIVARHWNLTMRIMQLEDDSAPQTMTPFWRMLTAWMLSRRLAKINPITFKFDQKDRGLLEEAVAIACRANVRHKNKGFTVGDRAPSEIMEHILDEAQELKESIDGGRPDIDELADMMVCVMNLVYTMHWTFSDVEKSGIRKMMLRLDLGPEIESKFNEMLEKS